MAAAFGLFNADEGADFGGRRQIAGRQKRVIFRVDRESRHGNGFQPGFGRGAPPVVVGPGKAVDGGGHGVVEFIEIDRPAHARFVKEAGELLQAVGRNGFQCGQEVAGVNPVEAVGQMVATGGEVERGAEGGDAGHQFAGRVATFASPFEQGVAAERNAGGVELLAAVGGVQAAQDPVDFFGIAGLVGARPVVQFARAAPKMGPREAPTGGFAGAGGRDGVMAVGAAFEAVEEDE